MECHATGHMLERGTAGQKAAWVDPSQAVLVFIPNRLHLIRPHCASGQQLFPWDPTKMGTKNGFDSYFFPVREK